MITFDGPNVHFMPDSEEEVKALSSSDIARFATGYMGQENAEPGICPGEPNAYRWRYEGVFPLASLAANTLGDAEWMAQEREYYGAGHMEDIAAWWLVAGWKEPVIFVVGLDGKTYITDGYHRTALSLEAGHTTVCAFVGVPILDEEGGF